jgi:hypothetical protein
MMKKRKTFDTKARELLARGGPRAKGKGEADPPGSAVVPYQPKPHEQEVIQAYLAKGDRAPRVTVTKKAGVVRVGTDHPEPAVGNVMLMQALGTQDSSFFDGIMSQLGNAAGKGQDIDEREMNFIVAAVRGI